MLSFVDLFIPFISSLYDDSTSSKASALAFFSLITFSNSSIAFFDDSDFERREVSENAPEVMVYTEKDIFDVLNNPCFDSVLFFQCLI